MLRRGCRCRYSHAGAVSLLKRKQPKAYKEFEDVCSLLEKHYKDMQDMEFTIQQGRLWMLQTRSGKRTAAAAVKIAVDMVKERLITKKEALLRVNPADLDQLLHPTFAAGKKSEVIGKGLPASPGASSGTFSTQTRPKSWPLRASRSFSSVSRPPRRHRWNACSTGDFNGAMRQDKTRGRSSSRHG